MNIMISIIVPVYNAGKYLRKCLDSIINQTYNNIEIILVDDGSTDDSPQICDEYADKDSRIRVIHQENSGCVGARKKGAESSHGEYILHVDSDDWIALDTCSSLIGKALETGADVVWSDYSFAFKDSTQRIPTDFSSSPIQLLHNILSGKTSGYLVSKLFKKEIGLKTLSYNTIGEDVAEDLMASVACLLLKPSIAYISEPLYFYYQDREVSIVKNLDTMGKSLYAGRNNLRRIYELLVQNNLFDEFSFEFDRLVLDVKIYLLFEGKIEEARQFYPFAHKDKRIYSCLSKSIRWIYYGALNWGVIGEMLFKFYILAKKVQPVRLRSSTICMVTTVFLHGDNGVLTW